jgi:hypothetical protein
MATANSKLLIDFGFDSRGTSNVTGDLDVTGSISVGGNLSFSGTTLGNFIPDQDQRSLGNTVNRWNLQGYVANIASTLTVAGATSLQDTVTLSKTLNSGNTTIVGFANASVSVNSALLTVGTSFIANTTGAFHTGTINAASFTTSGIRANTIAIVPTSNTILLGNSTGRFVISANSVDTVSIQSGTLSVSGNTALSGNATLSGVLQTISGNASFDSGVLFVDSVNNRVGINNTAPTVALEVIGAANISTSVNSALLTVGTSFIANTTGAFHTGTINAASFTVGTNFVANSSAVTTNGIVNLTSVSSSIRVGNSTINSFTNSTVLAIGTGNFSTAANVGANINITTSTVQVGNSTANLNANSSLLKISNATSTANLSPSNLVIGSTVVNSTIITIGTGNFSTAANVGANVNLTTSTFQIGNSTANLNANSSLVKISDATSTANLSTSSLTIGSSVVNSTIITIGTGNFSTAANVGANVNLTTSTFQIGNSTVNTQVNSTTISTNTGNFSLAANVGANVKLTTVLLSIGNSTVNSSVNSTSFFTTGNANVGTTLAAGNTTITGFANISTSVNSALLTVGTSFIANTTGAFHTGTINAASHTVGTSFIANTTGAFHTGTINAASFTTSGISANTTALVPTSNTILLGNSIGRFVLSANTGNFSGAVSGITTLAAGNTTVTGFVNATSTIQGGSSLTIAGAASGITTLAAGNTTITGFANASVSVNSALLTVGTSFIANTTGVFHTGTMNAASITIGSSSFTANSTAIVVADPLTANGSTGTAGHVLFSNGSTGSPYWSSPDATVTDDTSTNASRYLLFANQTSGSLSNIFVSSTQLTFNPSTGTLTSTVVTASSDERLKTNIETIPNPLQSLSKLRGVSFKRIDTGMEDYGVIAQEIESVMPHAVHENIDGFKSVSYNSIIGFLIEAIKDQQKQIDSILDSRLKNGN